MPARLKKIGKGVDDRAGKNRANLPQVWASDDVTLQPVLNWAAQNPAEAQQLALDSVRLLAATETRFGQLENQPFFKRCAMRFSGKTGQLERANFRDLLSIQKTSIRFMQGLQEKQILQGQAILTLKGQMDSLAFSLDGLQNDVADLYDRTEQNTRLIKVNQQMILAAGEVINIHTQEIREIRTLFAELVKELQTEFKSLESRTRNLEISDQLQTWLQTLDVRNYDKLHPGHISRMLRIVNDYYARKHENLAYNDILLMKKAIKVSGIDPDATLSIREMIEALVGDLLDYDEDFSEFPGLMLENAPQNVRDFSAFAINNISHPVFQVLHLFNLKYRDRVNIISSLQDGLKAEADPVEAIVRLISEDVEEHDINLNYRFSYGDLALELLGCLALANALLPASEAPRALPKAKPESPPLPAGIFFGLKGERIFHAVLNYLISQAAALQTDRPLLRNIIHGYVDKCGMKQLEAIPEAAATLANKFGLRLYRDNIFLFAEDNGRCFLVTRDDIILAGDDRTRSYARFDQHMPSSVILRRSRDENYKLESAKMEYQREKFLTSIKGKILKLGKKLAEKQRVNEEKPLSRMGPGVESICENVWNVFSEFRGAYYDAKQIINRFKKK